MRITNSMMISNYISNLNKSSNAMNKYQSQLSSGKRMARASDDPIAASKAMEVRANLSKVKQYSNNVIDAKELLGQTETSLNEINSLLSRAYELTVSAANGSNGVNEKQAIADEIKQISDQIVESANTNFKSNYIFGGQNTIQKPFEVKDVAGSEILFYNGQNVNIDDLTTLKTQRINYEIGFGTSMDISYNGIDILGSGSDNIFAVLNNLKNALKSGDDSVVKNSIDLVKNKQNNIISLLGEVGAKTNRLDIFSTRLDNDEYNYSTILENTEGISVEQAIMQLKVQETAYEAALAAGAKIITQTLADFIR